MTDDEKILSIDLFADDFGEQGDTVLSDKILFGRKEHACCHCKSTIKKKEKQRVHTAIYDSEIKVYRFCYACCQAMIKDYDEDDCINLENRFKDNSNEK